MKIILAAALGMAQPAFACPVETDSRAEVNAIRNGLFGVPQRDIEEMLAIAIHALCGPEGASDWRAGGPTCARDGWSWSKGRYAPETGQPWSCEDHIAEGEAPWPGCKYEGGRSDLRVGDAQ